MSFYFLFKGKTVKLCALKHSKCLVMVNIQQRRAYFSLTEEILGFV